MENPVITLSLPQLALALVPVGLTLLILLRWSLGTFLALCKHQALTSLTPTAPGKDA